MFLEFFADRAKKMLTGQKNADKICFFADILERKKKINFLL
jgi:hypothetical protein